MRVLAASGEITVTASLCDQFGEPVHPTAPITAVATRANGDDVPVDGTDLDGDLAVVQFAPGYMEELDEITVAIEDDDGRKATVVVQIVGGFWCTVAAIRAFDDAALATTRFPDERVRAAREDVEREFESRQATGVAWVPRFRRLIIEARGPLIVPDRMLRKVTAARYSTTVGHWTDVAPEFCALVQPSRIGEVVFPAGSFGPARWVDIAYEHGHDSPPTDLLEAFLKRVRNRLLQPQSAVPERATSMTTADGIVMPLSTPGVRGAVTGLPEIDVVLKRYRRMTPAIS